MNVPEHTQHKLIVQRPDGQQHTGQVNNHTRVESSQIMFHETKWDIVLLSRE